MRMYEVDKPSEGNSDVIEIQWRQNTNQLFSEEGKLGF